MTLSLAYVPAHLDCGAVTYFLLMTGYLRITVKVEKKTSHKKSEF